MGEMRLKWTGLLVEPNPENQKSLTTKNRRAYVYKGCLSMSSRVEEMHFQLASNGGKNTGSMDPTRWTNDNSSEGFQFFPSTCAPLERILQVLNRYTIDFLNLDIEGLELAVLNTVDFKRIEIGVVLVELNGNDDAIIRILASNGFKRLRLTNGKLPQQDGIFVNPAYF